MAQLLSYRKYAKHRGVTLAAVQKALKTGRINAVVDQATGKLKIDPVIADAQWTRNTDVDQQLRGNGGVMPAMPAAQGLDLGSGSDDEDAGGAEAGDRLDLLKHRTREAKASAQLKEMQALERAAVLVHAAGVRKEAVETARRMRNALLAIPDRIAPVLDPASPSRAHKLLTEELQKVIRELSAGLDERAAGAAAAREPDATLV
jgi:hypothetical protein